MTRRLPVLVLVAVLATACSSHAETAPTTGDPDTGENEAESDSATTEEDTGTPDEDTGAPSVDTGTVDTSVAPDTYVPPEDTAKPDTKPPVDSGPKDTGPPACNPLTPGYYVTLDARRESLPAGLTWRGGLIPDGLYELKTYVEYNGPSGLGTYASGGKSGEAIEISGKSWKRSFRPVGGYPNRFENYDADLTGNEWKLTRTCGTTTSYTYGIYQRYSVTATGFLLFAGKDTTGSISTYVKK